MKKILAGVLTLFTLAWGWDLVYGSGLPQGDLLWVLRFEALNLSGILAFGLMSLIMVLATRPVWLERPLGGMDQVYRLHKWAGILAISLAGVHWLVEMSGDVIKGLIGRAGKIVREPGSSFFEVMRDLGKDLGEWAIYALLAMLVLTLWKRFPFRFWRQLHRGMPLLYLMLVIHVLYLAPQAYWYQAAGALLALCAGIGSLAALTSLFGRIGRSRRVAGEIIRVGQPAADVTEVCCRLEKGWPGHQAGQFAFLTLHAGEGEHPFTIASADRGDRTLSFQIKGLGDYTRGLAQRLSVGQPVSVEGPYGCFDFRSTKGRQVWIAGGIGVTPFLAALEARREASAGAPRVDLFYCTRGRQEDPFVGQLSSLCAGLRGVCLHVRDTGMEGPLTADALRNATGDLAGSELWFCGPSGFALALRQGLAGLGLGRLPWHQEAFEMR